MIAQIMADLTLLMIFKAYSRQDVRKRAVDAP